MQYAVVDGLEVITKGSLERHHHSFDSPRRAEIIRETAILKILVESEFKKNPQSDNTAQVVALMDVKSRS